jgi:hypothetical protein
MEPITFLRYILCCQLSTGIVQERDLETRECLDQVIAKWLKEVPPGGTSYIKEAGLVIRHSQPKMVVGISGSGHGISGSDCFVNRSSTSTPQHGIAKDFQFMVLDRYCLAEAQNDF